MKKSKKNRWVNYQNAQISSVVALNTIEPDFKLRLQPYEGRVLKIDLSFLEDRPQIASLFAKVLVAESGRYARRTIVFTTANLKSFIKFINYQHPEINDTSAITYEILQEFVAWMMDIQKYSLSTCANRFFSLKTFLKAARSLFPNAFSSAFDLPSCSFFKGNTKRRSTHALSEEVLRRLLAAAEKEVDEIQQGYREGDVPENLDPFIPFMVLISAKTAINAQSLYNISRDCLRPHPVDTNAFYVVWIKRRSKTGEQRQLHYVGSRAKGVIELLQFLAVYTCPLLDQAKEADRNMLFLYRYQGGNNNCGVAVARKSDINNKALRAFCKRNELPEIKMVQLRPSAATYLYKRTGGKLRKVQLLLGHADISTTIRYVKDSLVQSLHNKSIRTAQEALIERVTTIIPMEAKQALSDLADKLSPAQLQNIADGSYDTGTGKCRNPLDSPQPGQQKGKCCTLFLACLTCPNALFFLDDLPRVIALRDHLLSERGKMARGVWEVLYEDKIKIIEDDIINAFNKAQIDAAKRLATKITDMPVLMSKEVLT